MAFSTDEIKRLKKSGTIEEIAKLEAAARAKTEAAKEAAGGKAPQTKDTGMGDMEILRSLRRFIEGGRKENTGSIRPWPQPMPRPKPRPTPAPRPQKRPSMPGGPRPWYRGPGTFHGAPTALKDLADAGMAGEEGPTADEGPEGEVGAEEDYGMETGETTDTGAKMPQQTTGALGNLAVASKAFNPTQMQARRDMGLSGPGGAAGQSFGAGGASPYAKGGPIGAAGPPGQAGAAGPPNLPYNPTDPHVPMGTFGEGVGGVDWSIKNPYGTELHPSDMDRLASPVGGWGSLGPVPHPGMTNLGFREAEQARLEAEDALRPDLPPHLGGPPEPQQQTTFGPDNPFVVPFPFEPTEREAGMARIQGIFPNIETGPPGPHSRMDVTENLGAGPQVYPDINSDRTIEPTPTGQFFPEPPAPTPPAAPWRDPPSQVGGTIEHGTIRRDLRTGQETEIPGPTEPLMVSPSTREEFMQGSPPPGMPPMTPPVGVPGPMGAPGPSFGGFGNQPNTGPPDINAPNQGVSMGSNPRSPLNALAVSSGAMPGGVPRPPRRTTAFRPVNRLR